MLTARIGGFIFCDKIYGVIINFLNNRTNIEFGDKLLAVYTMVSLGLKKMFLYNFETPKGVWEIYGDFVKWSVQNLCHLKRVGLDFGFFSVVEGAVCKGIS